MNKSILAFAASAFMAVLSGQNAQAQTAVEHGNRTFYGFFLTNEHFNNANYPEYGFSKQTFAYPGDNELLLGYDGTVGMYALTCAEGIYYACPYKFSSSMKEPDALPVMTYNLANGLVEEIGDWKQDGATFKPSDMTYDILNKKIYAICYGSEEGTGIYELSMTDGSLKFVCKARGGVIAADANGRVFTIDHDGWLYQINLTNGVATPVFDTKCPGLSANQTIEFDHTTGELYWGSCTTSDFNNDEGLDLGDRGRTTHLRAIKVPVLPAGQDYTSDVKGFSITDYGEIGSNARFQGMYIPYAEGGFDAPGAVTDFKAVSNAEGNGTDVSFSLPVKTFGGDDLTSINGYAIYRDGVEVAYSTEAVTPGQKIVWAEKDFGEDGMYRYDVIVYNGEGDGPKTPAFAYIGHDRPAVAGDIKVVVADDFASTEISWTAPVSGFHFGTYDPASVSYDVVRLPDNYKVAEGIKETKATDTFFSRRMLRYSYQVIAKNAQGETVGTSAEFIAGPVKTAPVREDFLDQNTLFNSWMAYDNNNDGLTWLYGTTLGHAIFGDYEQCAEYIVSPTSIDANTKDADEWLISPPVRFEESKEYTVTFVARVFDEETVSLHIGPKNTVEGMNKLEDFILRPIGVDHTTGSMAFGTYRADIPASMAGQIGCVGLQLTTALGQVPTHYFQVTTIEIAEKGQESGIENIGADNSLAPVEYFNLNGIRVNADALTPGLYIKRQGSAVEKVLVK